MESLGGFVDPSLSTPRPSTPSQPPTSSSSASTPSPSNSTPTRDNAQTRATTSATEEVAGTTTLDLDKEVQNVIAGFGSFWGKVRKQSTAAFSSAEKQFESTRKDLNPLLSKAKANLDTFSTAARAEVQRLSEVPPASSTSTGGGQSGVVIGPDGLPMIIGGPEDDEIEPKKKLDKGKGVDRSEPSLLPSSTTSSSSSTTTTQDPSAAASAFFSKIQSQLSSMQDQAPQALHALSSNFTQFQDQLSHLNLKNSTAEEYLHKGEHWLSEFREEVSKLAKEAVQIVPPTSTTSTSSSNPLDSRKSEEFTLMKGMTRKDTLLSRLRSDPSIFRIDPSLPPLPSSNDLTDYRDFYSSFLKTLSEEEEKGLVGSERVKKEEKEGGEVLESTKREIIAPSSEEGRSGDKVTEEEFWKRYLFRVHLIEEEEEKRKKVLSVAQSEDEDFSWDMDDEETNASSTNPSSPPLVSNSSSKPPVPNSSSSSQPLSSSSSTPIPKVLASPPLDSTQTSKTSTSSPEQPEQPMALTPTTNQSPRTSSSDETRTSYDFVGERSGNPSVDGREEENEIVEREAEEETPRKEGVVGGGGEGEKKKSSVVVAEKQVEEEDEDSDWE